MWLMLKKVNLFLTPLTWPFPNALWSQVPSSDIIMDWLRNFTPPLNNAVWLVLVLAVVSDPFHHEANGTTKAYGRDMYEAHLFAALYAGCNISGGNAEAFPGQVG